MSARFGWVAGVVMFVAAAVLSVLDLWLCAAACLFVPVYLAGRWDRRRDQAAVDSALAVRDARITALEDEITYRYDAQHESRRADDDRRMPDNGGGHYSPAVLNDRNSTSTAATDRGVPAPQRATPLP